MIAAGRRKPMSWASTIHGVQLFESKGAAMGCSSPHPHGQVWASSFAERGRTRRRLQHAYFRERLPLLLDYAQRE
ncbi:hypothetical protein M8494_19900 [Serratia ureilytica]